MDIHQRSQEIPDDSAYNDLSRAYSVLLLSPTLSEVGRNACFDLCLPNAPKRERVILVSYRQSSDGVLRDWRDYVGELAAKLKIISVIESQPTVVDEKLADTYGEEVMTSVADPSNLTKLGITLSEQFDEWDQFDQKIVLCFDSITVMLQYLDISAVFRFLNVVVEKLHGVNGLGHFHMDPNAHDQQTVSRIMQVFDSVVEITDDGVAVRSR